MTVPDTEDRRFPPAAVPAAAALVGCLLLTLLVLFRSSRIDAADLQQRADAALAAGDSATAQLEYQHLLALEPNRPEHAYDLARAMDAAQRRHEAAAVLGTIAPATGGYAPAHLLLAEWIIEGRVMGNGVDDATLKSAAAHLDAAARDSKCAERAVTLRAVLDKLLLQKS